MTTDSDGVNLHIAKIDVLLADYAARGEEVTQLSQRFGTLTNLTVILLAIMAAILGVPLPGVPGASIGFDPKAPVDQAMLPFFAVLVPCVVLYLVTATMDVVHMIFVNGGRRAMIEERINKLLDEENLLLWDLHVAPKLFVNATHDFRIGWIKPSILQAVFLIAIYAVVGALAVKISALYSLRAGITYGAALSFIVAYVAYQWGALLLLVKCSEFDVSKDGGKRRCQLSNEPAPPMGTAD